MASQRPRNDPWQVELLSLVSATHCNVLGLRIDPPSLTGPSLSGWGQTNSLAVLFWLLLRQGTAPALAAARIGQQIYSIRIASVSRTIRIIKRSICAILCTESAGPANRGHALPEVGKTAIRRASKGATIVCAPRIILGFGLRSYSDSKNENPHYEYRYSHDYLPLTVVCQGRKNGVPSIWSSRYTIQPITHRY
jgi:hypothetical protein